MIAPLRRNLGSFALAGMALLLSDASAGAASVLEGNLNTSVLHFTNVLSKADITLSNVTSAGPSPIPVHRYEPENVAYNRFGTPPAPGGSIAAVATNEMVDGDWLTSASATFTTPPGGPTSMTIGALPPGGIAGIVDANGAKDGASGRVSSTLTIGDATTDDRIRFELEAFASAEDIDFIVQDPAAGLIEGADVQVSLQGNVWFFTSGASSTLHGYLSLPTISYTSDIGPGSTESLFLQVYRQDDPFGGGAYSEFYQGDLLANPSLPSQIEVYGNSFYVIQVTYTMTTLSGYDPTTTIALDFGLSPQPGQPPVPEPATLALAGLGAVTAIARRRGA